MEGRAVEDGDQNLVVAQLAESVANLTKANESAGSVNTHEALGHVGALSRVLGQIDVTLTQKQNTADEALALLSQFMTLANRQSSTAHSKNSELDAMKAQVAAANEKEARCEAEVLEAKAQAEQQAKTIANLKEQVAAANDEAMSVAADNQKANAEIEKQALVVASKEVEKQAALDESAGLRAELEGIKVQVAALDKVTMEKAALEDQMHVLKTSLDDQMTAFKSTIDGHVREKGDQKEVIERLKLDVSGIRDQLELAEAQCAQKVKENEVFRECMGEINQELKLRDVTLALRDKRIKSYQNTISSLCVK